MLQAIQTFIRVNVCVAWLSGDFVTMFQLLMLLIFASNMCGCLFSLPASLSYSFSLSPKMWRFCLLCRTRHFLSLDAVFAFLIRLPESCCCPLLVQHSCLSLSFHPERTPAPTLNSDIPIPPALGWVKMCSTQSPYPATLPHTCHTCESALCSFFLSTYQSLSIFVLESDCACLCMFAHTVGWMHTHTHTVISAAAEPATRGNMEL